MNEGIDLSNKTNFVQEGMAIIFLIRDILGSNLIQETG
jgi:hypothetical protein